ncbi:MAG: hypothetical protein HQM10_07740 [Candidatus Riflebacteria bacterium]|nr:hypothetical protein [Candidatus Riflebacteria bacterium]
MSKNYLVLFWLLIYLFSFPLHLFSASTMMTNGTWCSAVSLGLVQAEIDGKPMMVVLPRLEFNSEVNPAELLEKLKTLVKKQDAIFHLYHDGLGKPKREGMKFFASDVFLRKLKMTYSGALRAWGYSFKVSKKAPFEEPDYLRDLESGAFVSSANSRMSASASAAAAKASAKTSESVRTSWDVMPAGVLPPSVRKMKDEIAARIAAVKSRPYKFEKPKVDTVRWASGKMGLLSADGSITNASVEGRKLNLKIDCPENAEWLKEEMAKSINEARCEFIFHRDCNGREVKVSDKYLLADIYFTDSAKTWQEWVEETGNSLSGKLTVPGAATAPVVLDIKVVDGVWCGMLTPVLMKVKFEANDYGLNSEEIIRFPGLKLKSDAVFADVSRKFNSITSANPVKISILVSPDGKPYTEFDQKRASVIWFTQKNQSLQSIIDKGL